MIKKYEFPTQEAAISALNAEVVAQGFLQVEGAENAVDLGHITLLDAVMDGDEVVTPAVLSVGYCVDVMWADTPPASLAAYEVTPTIPKHSFNGSE